MVSDTHPRRRTRGPVRRLLTAVLVAVVALVAFSAVAWALRSTERDTYAIEDPFDRVVVDVSAGSVTLEASADESSSLTASTAASLFSSADVEYSVEGDDLVVTGSCRRGFPWLFGLGCSTDVVLTVPPGVAVVAESSAGSITTVGLTAEANLRSSAGGVRVNGHDGPLTARSSAGRVVVTDLVSDDAELSSSAGGVEVTAIEPPESLRVSSSAGGVTVTLPGDVAYDLEADTSAGSTTIEVPTDPSSPYRIEAKSSAGSVTVRAG